MAFEKAVTSFGSIEEKLRKLFSLAGRIGASFEPAITPTVVIGNLDGPGYASFRGRHFAYISEVAAMPPPANGLVGWLTPVDVILTGILAVGQAPPGNTSLLAYLLAPGATAPAFATAGAGTWIDQKATTNDAVPFFCTTGIVVSAPTVATFSIANRIGAWGGTGWVPLLTLGELHLPAGSAVVWDGANMVASGLRVGLHGRIF